MSDENFGRALQSPFGEFAVTGQKTHAIVQPQKRCGGNQFSDEGGVISDQRNWTVSLRIKRTSRSKEASAPTCFFPTDRSSRNRSKLLLRVRCVHPHP